MIKGRYVAQVEIDFHIDEDSSKNILSFEEIKQNLDGNMDTLIHDALTDYSDEDMATVRVTRQYFDLYKVEQEG